MQRATLTLTTVAMGMVAVAFAASLLAANQAIPSNGTLISVGVCVFWDQACTNPVSSIDWGFLRPDTSTNHTVYIHNNGTAAEVLSMTTDNWNPTEAASYITLDWDREDHVLYHDAVVSATLALSVSPDIDNIETFSFNIIIVGTENQ